MHLTSSALLSKEAEWAATATDDTKEDGDYHHTKQDSYDLWYAGGKIGGYLYYLYS